jgi:23S rRNA pseudouridine1911/1915/1917 synthase
MGIRRLPSRLSNDLDMQADVPKPSSLRQLLVPEDLHGARLDRCLAKLMPEVSRTRIQAWIAEGAVMVNGSLPAKAGVSVTSGAQLAIDMRVEDRRRHEDPREVRLAILAVDEHLIVVNKPPGMLAHPTQVLFGATVSELAVREFGELPNAQGRDRPGIAHRLDAGTSGVMVLARTQLAMDGLLRQFRAREVRKTYTAIVHNQPRFDSDWIEAAIGRNPKAPQKRVVVAEGEGRASSTFYTVRERFRSCAVLECQPKTGRTHQIRVHLTHIGLPLVGDRTYKHHGPLRTPYPKSAPQLTRQALHASALEFAHPATGKLVRFEAPLAQDMVDVLEWLRTECAV